MGGNKVGPIIIWKYKEPKIPKTIFKKNRVGKLTLPEYETYYKAK